MSNRVLDPSGQAASPTNPNIFDVPCECGHVNQVEIFQARMYNMRQTSQVISEHCPPFMCPGCIRLVTPCIVSVRNVVFVCQPLQSKEVLAGAPAATTEIPGAAAEEKTQAIDGAPVATEEVDSPPPTKSLVM